MLKFLYSAYLLAVAEKQAGETYTHIHTGRLYRMPGAPLTEAYSALCDTVNALLNPLLVLNTYQTFMHVHLKQLSKMEEQIRYESINVGIN